MKGEISFGPCNICEIYRIRTPDRDINKITFDKFVHNKHVRMWGITNPFMSTALLPPSKHLAFLYNEWKCGNLGWLGEALSML